MSYHMEKGTGPSVRRLEFISGCAISSFQDYRQVTYSFRVFYFFICGMEIKIYRFIRLLKMGSIEKICAKLIYKQ